MVIEMGISKQEQHNLEKQQKTSNNVVTNNQNDDEEDFITPDDTMVREPIKGYKFPMKKSNGIFVFNTVINPWCLKNMQLKSDDILIIGFPKSGTTWIEELVWDLSHNLDFETAKSMDHFVRIPWADMGFTSKLLTKSPPPRCFKTHLTIDFMPENFNKIAKVIYVVRNPKDVVISSFDYYRGCDNENEFIGTLDDMVNVFVQGKTIYGPWWAHVNQFTQLEGVHVIHYEDLVEQPIDRVRKLANFLDIKVSDDQIRTLLNFVSFDNLKHLPSLDSTSLSNVGDVYKSDFCFFNKGKIGNWKNYLNAEHSEKIDEMVKTDLKYNKPFKYEPSEKL